MSDMLLKNSEGKLWKDSNGKIIKAKALSEDVLQNGLVFWGRAESRYLTFVDGLVSEANDIRGNGLKMTQGSVAYRPTLDSLGLLFSNANSKLSINSQTARSVFVVIKIPAGNTVHGIKGTGPTLGTTTSTYGYGSFPSYNLSYYLNSTKFNSTQANSYNMIILSSASDFQTVAGTITLGDLYGYANACHIKEWGWYNRLLSDIEVIYNINALNKRHSIFTP